MKLSVALVGLAALLQADWTGADSYAVDDITMPMPMIKPVRAEEPTLEPTTGVDLLLVNGDLVPDDDGGLTSAYQPSSPLLPPLEVLDLDGDGVVTPAEWTEYTQKIMHSATSMANRIIDPHAKSLMTDIVTFHYANLNDCLQRNTQAGWSPETLAAKCNVKFQYSLLAGPTPFEWIARKEPEVFSDQVSKWFDTQFQLAVKDVNAGRIRGGMGNSIPAIKTRLECLEKLVASRHSDTITKSDYYQLVGAVHECANASP